jgi:hypothetical protein
VRRTFKIKEYVMCRDIRSKEFYLCYVCNLSYDDKMICLREVNSDTKYIWIAWHSKRIHLATPSEICYYKLVN